MARHYLTLNISAVIQDTLLLQTNNRKYMWPVELCHCQ